MYEEPSPLEWIVVNAVIPSVVVTFLMHPGMVPTPHAPPSLPYFDVGYALFVDEPLEILSLPHRDAGLECVGTANLDDDIPVILRWTRAGSPAHVLRAGVAGCVVLEAAIAPSGRVDPSSIIVVSASDRSLVGPARWTLMTRFRMLPGSWHRLPARVRAPFEFISN
jgi:hypothetical protein